jgi:hypothetical protein
MPVLSDYLRYDDYIVDKIKEPLKRAAVTFLGGGIINTVKALWGVREVLKAVRSLPVPTKENTGTHRNTHALIDIRDYIFARLRLPGFFYDRLYELASLLIIIYDTHFWGPCIDVFLWKVKESDLKPLGKNQPDPHYWDHGVENK